MPPPCGACETVPLRRSPSHSARVSRTRSSRASPSPRTTATRSRITSREPSCGNNSSLSSWIAHATDPRLNVMPPIAEMGQLATMLVSSRDRFVSVGQLVALVATMGRRRAVRPADSVTTLERRSSARSSSPTLPVVILQAASALNDLVVCSFLLVRRGIAHSPRARSAVIASARSRRALAVGTKVTAVFGLPWIALARRRVDAPTAGTFDGRTGRRRRSG